MPFRERTTSKDSPPTEIRSASRRPILISGDGPTFGVDSKLRAQLRLEAIDALETHYRAGGKTWHQPKELANAATDRLLELVGIKNVV
ncbi:MAG: hypothetical protein O2983_02225 [Planctomycetota bacterium]|nr:hypothetical protein [Planctomycetota bacterium]MDA0919309.1 hypothetical protein [Planctomycetota bacterium]MDA1158403.1 hypothetical protein [Planctomycetota bacterium]